MKGVFQHEIQVRSPAEPANHEIFLPHEFKRITALNVEVQPGNLHLLMMNLSSLKSAQFGLLSFRQDLPGDIFFQIPVSAVASYEQDYSPLGLTDPSGPMVGGGGFPVCGCQIKSWPMEFAGNYSRLSLHYRDQFNQRLFAYLAYSLKLTFYYDK